ncbi:hypothetical protein PUNSTDRAFT_66908, partial [Punctularia strigosozonata HHB-11173 SS5]|uniref:uncharacterized protein n=1 Tax=Punctularia strigosozonata (strain HHB-11173) TaxID=741275 RepID=UPI0004417945
NFRRWLRRQSCPPAILQCRDLFHKHYAPLSDEHPGIFEEHLARARLRAHGTVYARSRTHGGNSQVMFHPDGNPKTPAVAGSIEHIFASGEHLAFAVRRYKPITSGTVDPFSRWPEFPAKLWSTAQEDTLELVKVNSVMCQYARYDVSNKNMVVLMLPRVSSVSSTFRWLFTPSTVLIISRVCSARVAPTMLAWTLIPSPYGRRIAQLYGLA